MSRKCMCPSFRAGAVIVAIMDCFWSSFVCAFSASEREPSGIFYRRLSWRTRYRARLSVAQTLAASCFDDCRSAPRALSSGSCRSLLSFFVFSGGTACFRYASHEHLQALRISHRCCDVNVMSLKPGMSRTCTGNLPIASRTASCKASHGVPCGVPWDHLEI